MLKILFWFSTEDPGHQEHTRQMHTGVRISALPISKGQFLTHHHQYVEVAEVLSIVLAY